MQIFARLASYRELWSIHNVRWLFLARSLRSMIFYSTVMVQFQASRGLNFTEMFALESILSLASWLFDIPTGIWADQLGYRRLLLLGHALEIVGMVIFVLGYGFWPFALASALSGMSLACASGCEEALIYESIPREQALALGAPAFSMLNAGSSAGFLSGLAVGSFLATHDLARPFILTLIPLSLSFIATLCLHPVARRETREHASVDAPRARDFLRSALQLLHEQPATAGLSLTESAAFALVNAIFWYNQPYFSRAGIPIAWFGPITAAAVGLGMLVVLATPTAKRMLGTYGALALSCFIPGIAYIALSMTRTPAPTMLLVALVAAGQVWRQPIINDELNRRIKDGSRATTLSVLSFIGTLAGIILNPLVGRAGDLGLSVTGLSLGAGLLLLGLLARIFL